VPDLGQMRPCAS